MNANDENNRPPTPRGNANKDAARLGTSADESAPAAFDHLADEVDTPLVIGPRSDATASDPRPSADVDGRPPSLEAGVSLPFLGSSDASPPKMHLPACTEEIDGPASAMDGDKPLGDSASLQGRDGHARTAGITFAVTDSPPEPGPGKSFTWNVQIADYAVVMNLDSPAYCWRDAEEKNADSPADGSGFIGASSEIRFASGCLPERLTIDPLTGLISGTDPGWAARSAK